MSQVAGPPLARGFGVTRFSLDEVPDIKSPLQDPGSGGGMTAQGVVVAALTSHQDFFEPLGEVENFLLRDAMRHPLVFVPLDRVTDLLQFLV